MTTEEPCDEDFENQYGECYFGSECCVPSYYHYPHECYTAEMAEEQYRYYREIQLRDEYPFMEFLYSIRDWWSSMRRWDLKEILNNWWKNDSYEDIPF